MEPGLNAFVAILGIAMLVALLARRLRLPYSVGLALVGALLASTNIAPHISLTHGLIYNFILPPLLFEAALTMSWERLRADLWTVVAFATLGTVLSAAITTLGMVFFLGWPTAPALVFGVLIAATDPVAVIALFKDQGVHGRLRLLVESESLFNDGVAAVMFSVVLAVISPGMGTEPWTASFFASLAGIAFGGVAVGFGVGGVAVILAGRTTDHLVESALTLVAAYGAFGIAEALHVSGVLAAVAAGFLMGNLALLQPRHPGPFTRQGSAFVMSFWEFAAFLANSLVFPLIGVAVASMPFAVVGAVPLFEIIAIVLASRALTVYPISFLFRGSSLAIGWRDQHVLFWGGLRGALALALSLALPPDLPMRDQIVVATFSVAAFSIVVQGLTMPMLLRALGVKTHSAPPR